MKKIFGLCVAIVVCGCAITESGNPPVIPIIDTAQIHENVVVLSNGFSLFAPAGAITPGGGTVFLVNLDTSEDEASATVQADGSFEINADFGEFDTYRLWIEQGSVASEPFDFSLSGGALVPLTNALDCLEVDPEFDAKVTDSGLVVTATNGCDAAVTIAVPTLRTGTAGFSVAGEAATLAPGEHASWNISRETSATHDILFIHATSGDDERRAITLFAE